MARYSKLAPNTVKHVGGKPSGKEVVTRRSKLEAALTAGFVQEEGFIVTRKLLQNNCSVSIKGREGHKIALDEWVEAYLVQPLKNYATGKLLLTKTNVARY